MDCDLTTAKAELAARLRVVCGHFSDDQFDRLLDDIIRMRLRFARIDADPRGQTPLRLPDSTEPNDD